MRNLRYRSRQSSGAAYALTTMALPSFTDEHTLFGDAAAEATAARLTDLGVPEIAVKCGPGGRLRRTRDGLETIEPTPRIDQPVDTTPAGDSFNAACIAARPTGAPPGEAARAGAERAARASCIPERSSRTDRQIGQLRQGVPGWGVGRTEPSPASGEASQGVELAKPHFMSFGQSVA